MVHYGGGDAIFGGECVKSEFIIKEMLQILLFGHEHNRNNRDNWIDVTTNDSCSNYVKNKDQKYGNVTLKFEDQTLLYDYRSCSHDSCTNNQCIKIKANKGAKECGCTNGLSVLDIDKINAAYNCIECFNHRWKHVKNVDEIKTKFDGSFPSGDGNNTVCRGFYNGEIVVGELVATEGCHVWGSNKIEIIKDDFEILTNENENINATLIWSKQKVGNKVPPEAIKGGRDEK